MPLRTPAKEDKDKEKDKDKDKETTDTDQETTDTDKETTDAYCPDWQEALLAAINKKGEEKDELLVEQLNDDEDKNLM